ncbi:MAG: arginase family protein [Bradymonadia bacterium]
MNTRARLEQMCRPAGGGIHVVSTGVTEQRALQKALYHVDTDDAVESGWRAALDGLGEARVVVLGVPSDNGAGFTRGANKAPEEIRRHLLSQTGHPYHHAGVLDVGDVRVVPHLLSEEMLHDTQISACRLALYGEKDARMPVSPLDLCASALDALAELAPQAVPVVIGGDHSIGWPAFHHAWRRHEQQGGRRLALLHFDAHTDLMPHRLGVKYCFATWAWHANELLGRDTRLVQLGIRASGKSKHHWESTLGVWQLWADECNATDPEVLGKQIAEHYAQLGCDGLYVSNDIDGTDPQWASATGTPEPGGLRPEWVSALTRRVAQDLPLVGGDLVEVAPPLAHERPEEPEITLQTAGQYLGDLIDLALRK